MRGYSVATAALALGVEHKWLDNLLSQNQVHGVSQSRQGVQRRLAPAALYAIATTHRLNRGFQIPVGKALALAHELWRAPATGLPGDPATLPVDGINIVVDREELRALVDDAVAGALEIAPRTRRGRPRGKRA